MKYKFVYLGGVGEIEEKKSRFIATVRPVTSEEEALRFLSEKKKEYWDARHNCHAFLIGENSELQRCSDDGEPSGTAGRPMLEVLLKEHLHDTAVVVTRYFGGTLLGTGGLVRAYQGAVKEALKVCRIAEKEKGRELRVRTDYQDLGRLQHLLAEKHYAVIDTVYEDVVTTKVMVPEEEKELLTSEITDTTGGRAILSMGEPEIYARIGDEFLRTAKNR